MELEREWRAALANHQDAQALYEWLAPSHQAAFVEWIKESELPHRSARIDEAISFLRAS